MRRERFGQRHVFFLYCTRAKRTKLQNVPGFKELLSGLLVTGLSGKAFLGRGSLFGCKRSQLGRSHGRAIPGRIGIKA